MDGYANEGMMSQVVGTSDFQRIARDESGLSDSRIIPQITFMSSQLEKTHVLLSDLQQKLEAILLPNLPSIDVNKMADATPPSKPTSSLSGMLDECNTSIGDIQRRINVIGERIQL